MKSLSITFSGVAKIDAKIIYKGVECNYRDDGDKVWVLPMKPVDKISEYVGSGKYISKEEFNTLINNA